MKDKGFTLMEMLGVIIVLAILAIITIPIMINIIERTRKNAAKNTALGYLSGIEEYIQMNDLGNEKYFNVIEKNKVYQVSEIGYEALGEDEIKDKEIVENGNLNSLLGNTIKGDKPSEGIVSLDEKGKIVYAELIIKKYIVVCSNDTNCSVNKAYEDRVKPKLTIGNVTSIKDSVTIPYTLIAGSSGASVECIYGTEENNLNKKGEVDETNKRCELSNLKSDTTYYFKLTPTSGEGLVGKSVSGNIITQKGTISAILQKDGEKESDGKYYFDKDTTTNNIILGDYCWLAINTDEEGNTRLIYNGEVKNGQCTGENASIGESKFSTVYNESDYETSAIKTVVDNWYNDHLSTNYSEKINSIDLITKEEAEIVGGGYLASGQKYWTQTPSGTNTSTTASCSISFSYSTVGVVRSSCSTSPSGEIYSSGIYMVDISGSTVNSDNGTYGGSLSGTCSYCNVWVNKCMTGGYEECGGSCGVNWNLDRGCGCYGYANYNDSCTASASGSSLAVRPVITLKSNAVLQGGEGTTSNPYYMK